MRRERKGRKAGVLVPGEAVSPRSGWPEVGSRAMHRILVGAEGEYPWIEVQSERYRFMVASAPIMVRIVIAEYLAAEVAWDF